MKLLQGHCTDCRGQHCSFAAFIVARFPSEDAEVSVSSSGVKMNQMEELKLFVSKRLEAAASEILGAIEKTIAGYEEQASNLKEENGRNRSLLDIIIQSNIAPTPGWCLELHRW